MNDVPCNVLVVGVGSIGERHVRCFQNSGRACLSICEVHDSLREKIGQRYGIERCYSDLAMALADPHDAVVVATPAHLHVSIAQKAADAGMHLLIEKPLAVSRDGVELLKQTVIRQGLVAAVAYVYRAHPALAAMKLAIEEGRFGKPLQLVAVAGQNFSSYRPAYRDTYYRDRATGGGAVQDAMTHIVNAAEWLVGPVDRLVVDAAHQFLEGVSVEDTVHLLARHGDVMSSYALNQYQPPNENAITVVCERGTARFELHRNLWRWNIEVDGEWQEESTPLQRDTLFTRQANAFLEAIEDHADPLCTLDEGLQTLRVNLAALDSLDDKEWQLIPR